MRIRLDPERVRIMPVWVRGWGSITRFRRPWRRPWTKEPVEVDVLKRLVVAVRIRIRDSPHLLLKLFKGIPTSDLESLLPHARVKTGPREMLKLLYVLAVPLTGLSWQTFSNYKRAIKDRDSERTKNLYSQNLANNASAIHLLASAVGQAEAKEALLAYAFCVSHRLDGAPGDLAGQLDQAIEAYLKRTFDADVNFDLPDALATIDRHGLWLDKPLLRVVPPDEELDIIEIHRREHRTADYHLTLID